MSRADACVCGHDETDHGFTLMPDRGSACIQCQCPRLRPADIRKELAKAQEDNRP